MNSFLLCSNQVLILQTTQVYPCLPLGLTEDVRFGRHFRGTALVPFSNSTATVIMARIEFSLRIMTLHGAVQITLIPKAKIRPQCMALWMRYFHNVTVPQCQYARDWLCENSTVGGAVS